MPLADLNKAPKSSIEALKGDLETNVQTGF